jgi:hypothetical protein
MIDAVRLVAEGVRWGSLPADFAAAEYFVRPGQVACRYSWTTPASVRAG